MLHHTDDLDEDRDLGDVYDALISVKHMWYVLGLHLGVETSKLDGIKVQHSQQLDMALLEMLKLWLKQTQKPRTWDTLVEALRRRTLSEEKVASEIETKYIGQDQTMAGIHMAIMLLVL